MGTAFSWFVLPLVLVHPVAATSNHACASPVQLIERRPEGPTEEDLEAGFQRRREALRASPEFQEDTADAHHHIGKTLHHRGDLTGAAEEYRLAVQRNPRFVEAYRDLCLLLLDYHDDASAVAALEYILQRGSPAFSRQAAFLTPAVRRSKVNKYPGGEV